MLRGGPGRCSRRAAGCLHVCCNLPRCNSNKFCRRRPERRESRRVPKSLGHKSRSRREQSWLGATQAELHAAAVPPAEKGVCSCCASGLEHLRGTHAQPPKGWAGLTQHPAAARRRRLPSVPQVSHVRGLRARHRARRNLRAVGAVEGGRSSGERTGWKRISWSSGTLRLRLAIFVPPARSIVSIPHHQSRRQRGRRSEVWLLALAQR